MARVRLYPNDDGTTTIMVSPTRPGEGKVVIKPNVPAEKFNAELDSAVQEVMGQGAAQTRYQLVPRGT